MPDRMHILDTGCPAFTGEESTEEKVTAIQSYLYMLMEELRYLLRHLDAENFTDAGLGELAEGMTRAAQQDGENPLNEFVFHTLSENLINNDELELDRLSTSRRIRKYLLRDTTDDNYVSLSGQGEQLITGRVENGEAAEQARNRFGQALYWQREPAGYTADGYPADENGEPVCAVTSPTAWPVTVYPYKKLVRAQLTFAPDGGGGEALPQLILGEGDAGGNSRGYIYKGEPGLCLRYRSARGKNVDAVFSDEGFVDAMHRRLSSLSLNREERTVTYQEEGSPALMSLSYAVDGDTVTFRWPDGHACGIRIPDDTGGVTLSDADPLADGEASPGESGEVSRADHRHPTDTTRASADLEINGHPLTGDFDLTAADVGALASGGTAVTARKLSNAHVISTTAAAGWYKFLEISMGTFTRQTLVICIESTYEQQCGILRIHTRRSSNGNPDQSIGWIAAGSKHYSVRWDYSGGVWSFYILKNSDINTLVFQMLARNNDNYGTWDSTAVAEPTAATPAETLTDLRASEAIADGNGNNIADGVLRFAAVTVSAGTAQQILSISDAKITADYVPAGITFADPAYITGGGSWASAAGSFTLTGTATAATTADVLLVRKGN